ncbi:MAG: hypothetical protein H7Y20_05265 [Bryobacteraceae bacterium]|nr:hypothetical protein [Bryobacteraceae bacterium]
MPASVTVEKIAYKGWPNCYRISNDEVELIATTDIGPRIIRYAFIGGQNMFVEFDSQLGGSGEKQWVPRGGHRIWIAPEDPATTYALDNSPVQIATDTAPFGHGSEAATEPRPQGVPMALRPINIDEEPVLLSRDQRERFFRGAGVSVTLTQQVEPETGLEKQIVVTLDPSGSGAKLVHRLTNTKNTAWQFAPWALSMMAPGGHGITGFPPRGTHPETLAPSNPLVMWAFTDLSDPRWTFTRKYLILKQDSANTGQPQKLGHFNTDTWGAYLLGSDLFIKQLKADPLQQYPDFHCSYQTFTNEKLLELETLGPLKMVEPGGTVEHVERWTLHKDVKIASWTDAELDRVLQPLLK